MGTAYTTPGTTPPTKQSIPVHAWFVFWVVGGDATWFETTNKCGALMEPVAHLASQKVQRQLL